MYFLWSLVSDDTEQVEVGQQDRGGIRTAHQSAQVRQGLRLQPRGSRQPVVFTGKFIVRHKGSTSEEQA